MSNALVLRHLQMIQSHREVELFEPLGEWQLHAIMTRLDERVPPPVAPPIAQKFDDRSRTLRFAHKGQRFAQGARNVGFGAGAYVGAIPRAIGGFYRGIRGQSIRPATPNADLVARLRQIAVSGPEQKAAIKKKEDEKKAAAKTPFPLPRSAATAPASAPASAPAPAAAAPPPPAAPSVHTEVPPTAAASPESPPATPPPAAPETLRGVVKPGAPKISPAAAMNAFAKDRSDKDRKAAPTAPTASPAPAPRQITGPSASRSAPDIGIARAAQARRQAPQAIAPKLITHNPFQKMKSRAPTKISPTLAGTTQSKRVASNFKAREGYSVKHVDGNVYTWQRRRDKEGNRTGPLELKNEKGRYPKNWDISNFKEVHQVRVPTRIPTFELESCINRIWDIADVLAEEAMRAERGEMVEQIHALAEQGMDAPRRQPQFFDIDASDAARYNAQQVRKSQREQNPFRRVASYVKARRAASQEKKRQQDFDDMVKKAQSSQEVRISAIKKKAQEPKTIATKPSPAPAPTSTPKPPSVPMNSARPAEVEVEETSRASLGGAGAQGGAVIHSIFAGRPMYPPRKTMEYPPRRKSQKTKKHWKGTLSPHEKRRIKHTVEMGVHANMRPSKRPKQLQWVESKDDKTDAPKRNSHEYVEKKRAERLAKAKIKKQRYLEQLSPEQQKARKDKYATFKKVKDARDINLKKRKDDRQKARDDRQKRKDSGQYVPYRNDRSISRRDSTPGQRPRPYGTSPAYWETTEGAESGHQMTRAELDKAKAGWTKEATAKRKKAYDIRMAKERATPPKETSYNYHKDADDDAAKYARQLRKARTLGYTSTDEWTEAVEVLEGVISKMRSTRAQKMQKTMRHSGSDSSIQRSPKHPSKAGLSTAMRSIAHSATPKPSVKDRKKARSKEDREYDLSGQMGWEKGSDSRVDRRKHGVRSGDTVKKAVAGIRYGSYLRDKFQRGGPPKSKFHAMIGRETTESEDRETQQSRDAAKRSTEQKTSIASHEAEMVKHKKFMSDYLMRKKKLTADFAVYNKWKNSPEGKKELKRQAYKQGVKTRTNAYRKHLMGDGRKLTR